MRPGEWRELAANLAKNTILYRNVNGQVYYGDMSAIWSNFLAWNPATQEFFPGKISCQALDPALCLFCPPNLKKEWPCLS